MLRRLALAAALAAASAAPASAQPAPAPKLVVFITVDQMRPDYFTRWPGQLTGGLGRLWNGGAVFTDAHQDHAITETAPGHSVVLSGRFPRGTGIVSNSSGVYPDSQTALVGFDSVGSSPFRFRGTVLMDWMRTADPRSRGLSVSRKDRGAILPMGRAHQKVFWYAPNGSFVTSTYYADSLPAWVREFNARRLPQGYAGQMWTLVADPAQYAEKDDVLAENRHRDVVFPHRFPSTPDSAAAALPSYPAMDSVTLQMALAGVRAMRLGQGAATDLLAVSLSTTDAVGHAFGPDSREIHDQVLRLDRWLGAFLDSLQAGRDPSAIVVALTADHGVTPYPEVADPAHAASMHVSDDAMREWTRAAAARLGVDTSAVRFEEGGLLRLDPAALARAERDPQAVAREFAAFARARPGVLRADFVGALAAGDTVNDAVTRRWLHMVPRDLPFYVAVTLRPGSVWGNRPFAEHGSPSDLDTHVPMIFYGAPFRAEKIGGFVRTVDIAPTLARVLGVNPTEPIDGRVLTQALR